MDDWTPLIGYILTPLVSIVGAWLAFNVQIKRVKAQNQRDNQEGEAVIIKARQESDSAITKAWQEIFNTVVDPLRKRIDELEAKLDDVEAEKGELKEWAESLFQQLVEAGLKPKPFKRKSKE